MNTQPSSLIQKRNQNRSRSLLAGIILAVLGFVPTVLATNIYFDVNGTTAGFGSPTSGTSPNAYTLVGNFWDLTAAGTGASQAYAQADVMCFGNVASDFNGNTFQISMNGANINGGTGINVISTNANITLTATDNTHASSPWPIAVAGVSTLAINDTHQTPGGLNWNSSSTTFTGTGTNNFLSYLGANCNNGTIMTINMPASAPFGAGSVNLNWTVAGTGTFLGKYTLTAGNLNFQTAAACGNFLSASTANPCFNINGGTIDNTSGSAQTLAMGAHGYSFGGNFTFNGSSSLDFGTAPVAITANNTVTVNANTLAIGGVISGVNSLTVAGNGILSLYGANTYSGNTLVLGGTLALTNSGSINSSPSVFASNGAFNVSGVSSPFSYPYAIGLTNGTLGLGAVLATVNAVSFTNSTLSLVANINSGSPPTTTNLMTGILNTSGAANIIKITSLANLPGSPTFPIQVPLINYGTASFSGGFNFSASLPPGVFGFISNNVANSSVDLLITNIPPPIVSLTWTGVTNGVADGNWDIFTTTNWVSSGTLQKYQDASPVTFDDSAVGGATNINLTTTLQPASVTFNNSALQYTLTGSGIISGTAGLTMSGSGTVIVDNSGTNNYSGGNLISAGTVQIGNNDAKGTLPGAVADNGTLIFAQTNKVVEPGIISGSGTVTTTNSGMTILTAANSYTGPTTIYNGSTLQVGDGNEATAQLGNANVNGSASSVTNNGVLAFSLNGQAATTWYNNITGNGSIQLLNNGINIYGVKLDGTNSGFTGGVTINTGVRLALETSFFANSSTVTVSNAGQFFVVVPGGLTYGGNISINGLGYTGDSTPLGAIRINASSASILAGTITLAGDSRIVSQNTAAIISGQITGNHNLQFGPAGTVTGTLTISNPNNNWTGDTTLNTPGGTGVNKLLMGASGVIPNGPGFGNLIMVGDNIADGNILDLDGYNQTVNGLICTNGSALTGTPASNVFVQNSSNSIVSTLTIGNNNATGIFAGVIRDNAGSGGQVALTKIGAGNETLYGANTYSGNTLVLGGKLILSQSGSISSSPQINVSNATFDISGASAYSGTGSIGLTNSTFNLGGTLATANNFSLSNSTVNISVPPSLPTAINLTGASGVLATGGTTNIINITSLPGLSYPAQFTVIKYTAADPNLVDVNNNLTTLGVQLPTLGHPVGYLTNNLGNSSIDLVLTSGAIPIVPITWNGAVNGSPNGNWDILTTSNWVTTSDGITPYKYQDASTVVFDDSLKGTTNVNLTTTLSPGSLTFNNVNSNYVFSGIGKISGTVGLNMTGSGILRLAESGGDNFSGGITVGSTSQNGTLILDDANSSISGGLNIDYGTVQVGNNDTNGLLPSGSVTDNGTLAFNQTANVTVNNVISGAGTLSQIGANTVTLGGVNSGLTGQIIVTNGILNVTAATALSSITAIMVTNNGTLDDNAIQFAGIATFPSLVVSGTGFNSAGAIINSGAQNVHAFANITVAGDVYLGGINRWDLRANVGNTASLNATPPGSPYKITKVGPNILALVGVGTIDSGLGDIDLQQGEFCVQLATAQLGNSASNLIVRAGATLEVFDLTTPINKVITLYGSGTNDTFFAEDGATNIQNNIIGPVTLNGNCWFDVANNMLATFGNSISGTGGLTKLNPGTLILTNINPYTGNTTVSNGVLFLTGNGSIGSSTNITVNAGATLDASQRIDSTLTLNSGQALFGNGTVNSNITANTGSTVFGNGTVTGNLLMSSGSFLSPGTSAGTIGTLTVNGTANLNGTTYMELNKSLSPSNDVLTASTTLYGGTLTVTNMGPALVSGDSFTLFSAGSSSGSFSVTNLPALSAGLSWTNSGVTWSVTGTAATVTNLRITNFSLSGGTNLVINGTNAGSGTYYVLASTNVALPLASWTPIATNVLSGSGSFTLTATNAVNTAAVKQQFYILSTTNE